MVFLFFVVVFCYELDRSFHLVDGQVLALITVYVVVVVVGIAHRIASIPLACLCLEGSILCISYLTKPRRVSVGCSGLGSHCSLSV